MYSYARYSKWIGSFALKSPPHLNPGPNDFQSAPSADSASIGSTVMSNARPFSCSDVPGGAAGYFRSPRRYARYRRSCTRRDRTVDVRTGFSPTYSAIPPSNSANWRNCESNSTKDGTALRSERLDPDPARDLGDPAHRRGLDDHAVAGAEHEVGNSDLARCAGAGVDRGEDDAAGQHEPRGDVDDATHVAAGREPEREVLPRRLAAVDRIPRRTGGNEAQEVEHMV